MTYSRLHPGICFQIFFIVAILVGASVRHAADVRPPKDQDVLPSADQALAGVDEICLIVVVRGNEQDGRLIDVPKLKGQIVEKLGEAGIKHVEGETRPMARLAVRIESTAVPDCDKHVCRVQIALSRVVMLFNRPDLQIQAEVWQSRPRIEVVAVQEAAGAISTAALAQAETFVAARRAARTPLASPQDITQDILAPTTLGHSFVSSKNSPVFHRPDCRWAQNIASSNLVGYKSREEAVQAGKRPCKVCQP